MIRLKGGDCRFKQNANIAALAAAATMAVCAAAAATTTTTMTTSFIHRANEPPSSDANTKSIHKSLFVNRIAKDRQWHDAGSVGGYNSFTTPKSFMAGLTTNPFRRVALCETYGGQEGTTTTTVGISSVQEKELPDTRQSSPPQPPSFVSNHDDNNNNNERQDSFYYERMKPPPRSYGESHAIFGPLLGSRLIERYNVYRRVYTTAITTTATRNINTSSSNKGTFKKQEVAIADVRIGDKLNGHEGIVHGGIISLLFDDAMGWGFDALVKSSASSSSLSWMEETRNESGPNGVKNAGSNGMAEETIKHEKKTSEVPMVVTANLNIDFRSPLYANTDAIIRIYYEGTERRKVFFSASLESRDGTIVFAEATSLFVMVKEKKKDERLKEQTKV